MPHFHYQLIPCEKCEGELYGPVGVKIEPEVPLEQQIRSVEFEICSSHPHHRLNGYLLKRYNDFEFPRY